MSKSYATTSLRVRNALGVRLDTLVVSVPPRFHGASPKRVFPGNMLQLLRTATGRVECLFAKEFTEDNGDMTRVELTEALEELKL